MLGSSWASCPMRREESIEESAATDDVSAEVEGCSGPKEVNGYGSKPLSSRVAVVV